MHNSGLTAVDFLNTPEYLGGAYSKAYNYKIAHETYSILPKAVKASETRPGVIADVADAFSCYYVPKEMRDELWRTAEVVMRSVREVLDKEHAFDIYLLCMISAYLRSSGRNTRTILSSRNARRCSFGTSLFRDMNIDHLKEDKIMGNKNNNIKDIFVIKALMLWHDPFCDAPPPVRFKTDHGKGR